MNKLVVSLLLTLLTNTVLAKENCSVPLVDAVNEGDFGKVKALLLLGANINKKDCYGNTALNRSIESRDYAKRLSMTKYLLKKGANVNAPGRDGETALMKAADNVNLEITQELLKHGANVQLKDEHQRTALHFLSSYGDDNVAMEIAKLLVEKGIDVNAKDDSGSTAITRVRLETAKFLIEHGADLKSRNNAGNTPLLSEMIRQFSDMKKVKLYIENGADKNAINNEGKSALTISYLEVDRIKSLVDLGITADAKGLFANVIKKMNCWVNDYQKEYDIKQYCSFANTAIKDFSFLLSEEFNIKLDDESNLDYILNSIKASCGFGTSAEYVYGYSTSGGNGRHRIDYCLPIKGKEFLDFYVHYKTLTGGELSVLKDGDTLLTLAMKFRHRELVQLLLPSLLNKTGAKGESPLMVAIDVSSSTDEELSELITKTENLNHQDNDGVTALMRLAKDESERNVELAKLLLARGADSKLQDKNGNTALMYAVENKFYKMVELLTK